MWEKLVATALMGTDRQTPEFEAVEGPLGQLLNQLDSQDPEGQVLGAAGAIAIARQVGSQPRTDAGENLAPCETEDLPRCCEAAHQALLRVLDGNFAPAFSELLTHLATHGQRIPEELLPRLLTLGRQRSEHRSAIQSVIGRRGRWLAQQNPDWSYIRPEDPVGDCDAENTEAAMNAEGMQAEWETGDTSSRINLLRYLRQADAGLSRQLLQKTWSQDKAKDRATFLDCFQVGLRPDDEPFLESALADRSQGVRAIAAQLLRQLPGSQFCERMAGRGQSLVQIQAHSKGVNIEVLLPNLEAPEFQNSPDGLTPKKLHGLGPRSSVLFQILSAVPLTCWDAIALPKDILMATASLDLQTVLLAGWQSAAQHQKNLDWARALAQSYLKMDITPLLGFTELISLLPLGEQETCLADWSAKHRQNKTWAERYESLQQIIAAHPHASLPFSQILLTRFEQDLQAELSGAQTKKDTYYPYQLRSLMDALAYYLDPAIFPEVQTIVIRLKEKKLDVNRSDLLDRWLEILEFRHHLKQIFVTP